MTNKFNQKEYVKDWTKKNMKQVAASYKTEFVEEFKAACQVLGVKQSDVFRKAMNETIEQAKNKPRPKTA